MGFFFLYNLLLWVISLTLLPFWLIGRKVKGKPALPYFTGFSPADTLKLEGKPVIWVQASSVGEARVAVTFLQEFRRVFPGFAVALTCTTQTGYATAQGLAEGLIDLLGFAPFDHPWVVQRFLRLLHPDVLVLIETELWPNLLHQCRKAEVRSIVVNGRLSDRSYKILCRMNFYGPIMGLVSFYCVQSESDKERFISLGAPPDRVRVTGNLKFEQRTSEDQKDRGAELLQALDLKEGSPVLTAGSTHDGEEELILEAFARIKQEVPEAVLILAPRHLERIDSIERLLSGSPYTWVKRSRMLRGEVFKGRRDLLLLDTYGELTIAYLISTVVFVGGSLVPIGGHNILEVALMGKVALFGPHMHNFRESKELLERIGAGILVRDAEELSRQFLRLIKEETLKIELGERARSVVQENQGASRRTVTVIKELMGEESNQITE